MKIALAQLNYTVGDFEGNKNKIIAAIKSARAKGAELIVFSELAICGFPPLDLLLQEKFIKKCLLALNEIAANCYEIAAIVGGLSNSNDLNEKKLYNSAWFLHKGKTILAARKTQLANHDVFFESRYFQPSQSLNMIEHNGKRLAITIGDDLQFNETALYNENFTLQQNGKLSKHNPDFLVNISAMPFAHDKHNERKQIICQKAKELDLPIFYINHRFHLLIN